VFPTASQATTGNSPRFPSMPRPATTTKCCDQRTSPCLSRFAPTLLRLPSSFSFERCRQTRQTHGYWRYWPNSNARKWVKRSCPLISRAPRIRLRHLSMDLRRRCLQTRKRPGILSICSSGIDLRLRVQNVDVHWRACGAGGGWLLLDRAVLSTLERILRLNISRLVEVFEWITDWNHRPVRVTQAA